MPTRKERWLIIPDLHLHSENADFWIERHPGARVLFLGDYFDDFKDSPEAAARMASWLRSRIESEPTWVFLVGNHDLPYLYPLDERLIGPGFHLSKRLEIASAIRGLDRSRLRLHYFLDDDLLLSHAGLHPGWLPRQDRHSAKVLLHEAEEALLLGRWHDLLAWGQDRGAISLSGPRVGGIAWMDWQNLVPLEFTHQIVGHTPSSAPRHKTRHGRFNLCLDIGNADVCATIDVANGERLLRVWKRDLGGMSLLLDHHLPKLN